MDVLTAFATRQQFERAVDLLDGLRLEYAVISPEPAYSRVGCPALVVPEEAKGRLLGGPGADIFSVGWADYRPSRHSVPDTEPRDFVEDIVGRVSIAILEPCVADAQRLRLRAHFSGDVVDALPYLNAEVRSGSYVARLPVFSFMDGHRMVSLHRDRVGVAKADDIVDCWATLERLRCLVNEIWARRDSITPSAELRRRPMALEIYKRLPGTNCKACGQATCMAFAWAVWRGEAEPRQCVPVFSGEGQDLRGALSAICAGLGIGSD